eukprot:CAMPEP_0194778138 /NCGR_PEP_ID=MMETSP0323_2-20130528/67440_1 /TAXON_ID=2866 ORGANISM="Crypthecodinium cohnii, Strain Seligo" /NCGR_SAMPLE_ID=MMETSP0323_2 /ASSEMBLY_ACC=CAM_ASM_000346 /LENGTH=33 /DNA_ID= /DNA_START= /DNA_END= /DNA_ORIENTATION=
MTSFTAGVVANSSECLAAALSNHFLRFSRAAGM